MQSTSSDPSTETTIIRTGSDGRLRGTPAPRGDLLEAFDRSGMSAMAFSRQHGISYQTFITRSHNLLKLLHWLASRSLPGHWLFIGSETTGQRAAIIHTMLECAKRHGHNPEPGSTTCSNASPP